MSCSAIATMLRMNAGAISYHLTGMRKKGLIEPIEGKWRALNGEAAVLATAAEKETPPIAPTPEPAPALRAEIILNKIELAHKPATPVIAPVVDLNLKLAVLDKLTDLYAEDVAEVLSGIHADVARLDAYAQQMVVG